MLDIGVSTGAARERCPAELALSGDLTLDASTLTSALQSDSSGVQSVLQSWSIQFSNVVNNEAAPGGDISTRIQGDDSQSSYIANQIDNMNAANAEKQQALVTPVRGHGVGAVAEPVDQQLADQPAQLTGGRLRSCAPAVTRRPEGSPASGSNFVTSTGEPASAHGQQACQDDASHE